MEGDIDYEELMRESSVSGNHGHKLPALAASSEEVYGGVHRPVMNLSAEENEISSALSDLGRLSVAIGDETYFGMVAHRGVLTEDEAEFLDWEVVEEKAEALLGCSMEELSELYGVAGRPSEDRILRRSVIDSRLLDVKLAGGNMLQLAVALGWSIETTPTGTKCRKMTQAIKRAIEYRRANA